MKNIVMLSLCLIALLSVEACKKDQPEVHNPGAEEKTLHQKIAGKWEATAFIVEETDQLGSLIESSAITFTPTAGNQGTVAWVIHHSDGTFKEENGNYEVDEALKVLDMLTNLDNQIVLTPVLHDSAHIDFTGLYFGERMILKTIKQ